MDLPRVPVYVRPRTVILTTVGITAGVLGLFFGSWRLAEQMTYARLNEHRKYGRPKEKP